MKLHIVSDGTGRGTKVLDEKGRMVEGVISLTWTVHANTLAVAHIDMVMAADIKALSAGMMRRISVWRTVAESMMVLFGGRKRISGITQKLSALWKAIQLFFQTALSGLRRPRYSRRDS